MDNSAPWHHRPAHLFTPNALYMVTASTLYKSHIFHTPEGLRLLTNTLFEVAKMYCWELQAWAVFANHYHIIAKSPEDGASLKPMIQRLHSITARETNKLDGTSGRKVWFQYWDTCLTHEKSLFARLNYVHNNPVKHGLVPVADQYPFCSARWFMTQAEPGFYRKVSSFRHDSVNVIDDF